MKVRNILVPTDLRAGDAALDHAAQLASQFGASITLLHIIEPMFAAGSDYYSPEMNMLAAQLEQDSLKILIRRVKEHFSRAKGVMPIIRHGSPWHEITRVARERGVDMTVIATRGYTGLKHLFLGSTAERVVRHSPCPVLVVRQPRMLLSDKSAASGRKSRASASEPLKKLIDFSRILVPVDFSEQSAQAAHKAAEFARSFNGKLLLLHVLQVRRSSPEVVDLDLSRYEAELRRQAEKRLTELTEAIDPAVAAEWCLQTGEPAEEIVRAIETTDAKLVFISTRGRTGLNHVLLGSVTEKVVRHASCPVLVVGQSPAK